MSRRLRLDAELVRRGLARSRDQAADLIAAGRVAVAGQTAVKAASQVAVDAAITVQQVSDEPEYVSRGGHKLAGALAAFDGLVVAGKRCLDAGASTGGFTDVLLRAGAAHVVAADVGYGQLAWSLQTDERVTVLDRVNVRSLSPAQVAPPPDLVVADLSFISLTLVLPALAGCAAPDADFVLMVKPQFEVGKDQVGGGVVRDPALRAAAVAGGGRGRRGRRARRRRRHREPAAGAVGQRGVLPVAPPRRGTAGRGDAARGRRGGAAVTAARRPAGAVPWPRHAAGRAHRQAGGASGSRRVLVDKLTAAGIAVRVLEPEAAELGCAAAAVVPVSPAAAAGAEMVLVVGGDGTLLRAAELARPAGVPLLGVNLGHVGFLAEAEPEDLSAAVASVVARRYTVEQRMTVEVDGPDQRLAE